MSPLSSPASSQDATQDTALTPSRKVQALLAQFSDSDSEGDNKHSNHKPSILSASCAASSTPESDESDEIDEVQPRGRLAARLLGGKPTPSSNIQPPQTIAHHETDSIPDSPHRNTTTIGTATSESSEDEIATAARKRKRTPLQHRNGADDKTSPLRSPSPLFFPSPSAVRHSVSPQIVSGSNIQAVSPARSEGKGRSKFLALVEKHRKDRLAREAAEVAKRAAGVVNSKNEKTKRVRGSSPADDTSEDNMSVDEDAVKRIQKQSRPTRKASKKALEEMHRETQRMSRNMHLAHQARTKVKITKESLLARFKFASDERDAEDQAAVAKDSTASSSVAASDAESGKDLLTSPPTSPLRELEDPMDEFDEPQAKDITHLFDAGQVSDEMHGALVHGDGLSALNDLTDRENLSTRMQWLIDYHSNDITVKSPTVSKTFALYESNEEDGPKAIPFAKTNPVKVSLVHTVLAQKDSDSDGEIEIIKDRGLKRKYAAFESLPKRKAKERPSHLALRSLAHLMGKDDKKKSMNAAELESTLMRKARLQAIEERRIRIEELRAKGIVVQTAEERERDQLEVEDLVERARQEATEIQKREKALAKKDGTYVKDNLDDEEDDDDSEDEDFAEEGEGSEHSGSEVDEDADNLGADNVEINLVDEQASEADSSEEADASQEEEEIDLEPETEHQTPLKKSQGLRVPRITRVISDDEEDEEEDMTSEVQKDIIEKKTMTPQLPRLGKTPVSIPRSARKIIPGLQMSDDLPMGLSQAFAATMAESQASDMVETQEQESLDLIESLPSPGFNHIPILQRFDSVDLITDSQPSTSQTQPLNINLVSQSQTVPESPRNIGIRGTQHTPSQRQIPFDLTQDNGYIFSPFLGNRFAESPMVNAPHSTVETEILPTGVEDSPIMQRRGRLQRGRAENQEPDVSVDEPKTAFQIMQRAAKAKIDQDNFDKKKSDARKIVDEAAEESEDEYAGLGGASDDSGDDEENEDDRRMIDEDTQVGAGDEAKLAGLFADRERERDEKEVSKLLKDITTGALRRKRGVGDDLDLSDEEDAAARRREAKRREFARMRRELLKDEAVGKIAEDKKKEAFLRSIEDREAADDDEDDGQFDQPETTQPSDSQIQSQGGDVLIADSQEDAQTGQIRKRPLDSTSESQLNRLPPALRRSNPVLARKPATLAEIRESVSFLIEEPDSQAAMVDLGLSDSEDDAEAYVDLDRHFREAEADENELDQDTEDLGDFVVADDLPTKQREQDEYFKKPELPRQDRAPFNERRTKHIEVVDRLSLLRQNSSASNAPSTASTSTKMAFFSSNSGVNLSGVPSLLRRATTNSSLGSMSGRENVSATGVVTNKTERGNATEEKEFIRKGNSGRRNAVNYQAERKTLREEKMSARSGALKANKSKTSSGFLGGLFRGDSWD